MTPVLPPRDFPATPALTHRSALTMAPTRLDLNGNSFRKPSLRTQVVGSLFQDHVLFPSYWGVVPRAALFSEKASCGTELGGGGI